MNKSMENLTKVLVAVEYELNGNNDREVKTLMNTYRTLLDKFKELPSESEVLTEIIEILTKHKIKLQELHEKVENIVSTMIVNREYKILDNLVEIDRRIEKSISDISLIIKSYNRFLNKPENNKVAILSRTKNRAISLLKQIVGENCDALINDKHSYVVQDDEKTYYAFGYSQSIRGRKFNEIYIDKDANFTDKEFNILGSTVHPKGGYTLQDCIKFI